jgi:cell division protein FtsW (lipid II flippase)
MKAAVWARRLPWSVLAAAVPLVLVGWMALARCEELADANGHFLRQQIVWSALGLAAMLVVSLPSYRLLCRWSYELFLASLALLVLVYFFPPINHAHRWIRVGPVGLQPAEFAKVAFVLALARYLMYRENYRRLPGLLLPLAISTAPVLLVLKEPDLGMALLFLPVLLVMLFVAGARRRDLALLALVGLLLMPLLWTQMSDDQKSRVTAVFHQVSADQRPAKEAYQLYQAKRMAALGGPWGSLAAGQATDDLAVYHLPEARTDFILSVIEERLGLPGLLAVLGLYGLLAWRGLAIAAATREPFGRLVATGITAMILMQAVINMGMNVGLLPITGLPLPMVSYGGSALLAHAMGLGLLLNVGLRPGYEVTNEPFRWLAAKS